MFREEGKKKSRNILTVVSHSPCSLDNQNEGAINLTKVFATSSYLAGKCQLWVELLESFFSEFF